MAGWSTVFTAIGMATQAFGTYKAVQTQKKQVKLQGRSLALQRQAQEKSDRFRDIQRAKQRQATVRDYYRKRATAVAMAERGGAMAPGSSTVGALGALRSGTQDQLTFFDVGQELSTDISNLTGQADIFSQATREAGQKASTYEAFGSFGSLAHTYRQPLAKTARWIFK